MNILEAFGVIFTGIWLFISSPLLMFVIGLLLLIFGVVFALGAIVVPHEGRSEMWERLATGVFGALMGINGSAMIMWVVTSSTSPFTWGQQ